MATNFPASLDTLTNPTSSDSLSSPSHSAQHANVNDAVEALQAKVGVDSSAVTSSHDYKIADHASRLTTLEAATNGKIVAVKYASLTAPQSASVAAGANVAVTSLSITHTLADAANKLIIHAHLGMAANSNQYGMVGLAVADDGTLIEIGDAAGSRTRVGSYNRTGTATTSVAQHTSLSFVYEPGDTSSHTYTVRAINVDTATRTLYINQSENAADNAAFARGASAFIIQEVSA